jgi:hypothetical protein
MPEYPDSMKSVRPYSKLHNYRAISRAEARSYNGSITTQSAVNLVAALVTGWGEGTGRLLLRSTLRGTESAPTSAV